LGARAADTEQTAGRGREEDSPPSPGRIVLRHRTFLLDRRSDCYGDFVGATQLDAAGADADARVALGVPVGATQALGAEAVAVATA
jgi:hypothetical protein